MTKIINDVPLFLEPKKTNRFLIKFPESFKLPNWISFKSSRPTAILGSKKPVWEPLIVHIYDFIEPSITRALFRLISEDKTKEKFEMTIQMLDPTGNVVEEWSLVDCSFEKIAFGELSYDLNEFAKCTLTIKLDKVTLNF